MAAVLPDVNPKLADVEWLSVSTSPVPGGFIRLTIHRDGGEVENVLDLSSESATKLAAIIVRELAEVV